MLLRDLAGPFSTSQARTSSGGGDTYVAIDSKIYCTTHKIDLFQDVGFPVRQLVVNASGTLIAARGDTQLVIISSNGTVESEFEQQEFIQVLWHPLALHDSCLLALVPSAVLVYYLSPSGLHSEKIDLTGTPNYSNPNSSAIVVEVRETPSDAVAMTFGSDADETGSFTLYLSTEEGEVFAISPLVPPQFTLSQSSLESLLSFAVTADYEYKERVDTDGDVDPSLGRVLKRQLAWIHDLHKQSKTAETVWRNRETQFVLSRPFRSSLAIQGPFELEPCPTDFYEQEVWGLASMKVDSLPLLVQCATTTVNIYVVSEPVNFMWAEAAAEELPVLPLAQVVTIADKQYNTIDTADDLLFLHGTDTLLIEPRVWASELLENGASGKLPRSQVTVLPRSLVNMRSSYAWTVSLDSSIDKGRKWRYGKVNVEAEVKTQPAGSANIRLESVLGRGEGGEQILSLLRNIRSRPASGISANGPINNNLQALTTLYEIAVAYNTQLGSLHKATETGAQQVRLQEQAFEEQMTQIQQAERIVKSLHKDDTAKLLEETQKRMVGIAERAKNIGIKLALGSRERPLSSQELKWATEVKRIQERIDGDSTNKGLAQRVSETQNLFSTNSKTEPSAWTGDLLALKRRLDSQADRIKELKAYLTQSSQGFD